MLTSRPPSKVGWTATVPMSTSRSPLKNMTRKEAVAGSSIILPVRSQRTLARMWEIGGVGEGGGADG